MLQEHIIDAAPSSQQKSSETFNSHSPSARSLPSPDEPDPAQVDWLVSCLDAGKFKLAERTFRDLWQAGRVRELGRLFYEVRTRWVKAIRTPSRADRKLKRPNPRYSPTWKILKRATDGHAEEVRPYFQPPRPPLSEEHRQRLGELWKIHEEELRKRAIQKTGSEEILSDVAMALMKPRVFNRLAPDYDSDHFLKLATGCMKFARMSRWRESSENRAKLHQFISRVQPATAAESPVPRVCAREAVSAVLEVIARMRNPRIRDGIISCRLNGESTDEVARRWNVEPANIANDISRSIKAMRKNMPESFDPGGSTTEEIAHQMVRLHDSGVSLPAISERFGVPERTIYRLMTRCRRTGKAVVRR